jgi:hypothetical protein
MIAAIQPIDPPAPNSALGAIDRRPQEQAKKHKIQGPTPEIKIFEDVYFPSLAD